MRRFIITIALIVTCLVAVKVQVGWLADEPVMLRLVSEDSLYSSYPRLPRFTTISRTEMDISSGISIVSVDAPAADVERAFELQGWKKSEAHGVEFFWTKDVYRRGRFLILALIDPQFHGEKADLIVIPEALKEGADERAVMLKALDVARTHPLPAPRNRSRDIPTSTREAKSERGAEKVTSRISGGAEKVGAEKVTSRISE